jgi:hypothetical protein
MGYVIVEFPERREVLVGGRSHGYNIDETTGEYAILTVGDGRRTFWLAEPLDYEPNTRTIVVGPEGTIISPQRVVFTKKV